MLKPLTDKEIKLFKFFNSKNLIDKKVKDGLRFVENVFKITDFPGDWKKIYYVYRDNYRPEGDYENITWENFVDKPKLKSKLIANRNAKDFTAKKLPFRASNLEGKWSYNYDGELIYVVYSYGHYPIYIFRDGVWLVNSDNYSMTTAKHISQSLPWQDRNSKIMMVDSDTMKNVAKYGEISNEDIIKSKKEKLGQDIESLLPKKLTNLKASSSTNYKIKFKIQNIELNDNEVNVIIKVLGLFDGPTLLNYNDPVVQQNFRYETMNPQLIEKNIINKLTSNLKEYLPPRKIEKYLDRETIPEDGFLKFTFQHNQN